MKRVRKRSSQVNPDRQLQQHAGGEVEGGVEACMSARGAILEPRMYYIG